MYYKIKIEVSRKLDHSYYISRKVKLHISEDRSQKAEVRLEIRRNVT